MEKGVWKLEHQLTNFVFEGRLVIKAGENILRGGDCETDRQFRYNFFRIFLFSFWDFSVPYQFRRLSYNVWVAPRPSPVNP